MSKRFVEKSLHQTPFLHTQASRTGRPTGSRDARVGEEASVASARASVASEPWSCFVHNHSGRHQRTGGTGGCRAGQTSTWHGPCPSELFFKSRGYLSTQRGAFYKKLYGFGFWFSAFDFCYAVFAAQKNTFVFANDGAFGFFAAFWAYVVCVRCQTNV